MSDQVWKTNHQKPPRRSNHHDFTLLNLNKTTGVEGGEGGGQTERVGGGRTWRVVVLTPDTPDAILRVSKSWWLGVEQPRAALRAARVSASRPSPPYPAQQSTAAQHSTAQG